MIGAHIRSKRSRFPEHAWSLQAMDCGFVRGGEIGVDSYDHQKEAGIARSLLWNGHSFHI